jgi:hypothetical protein
LALFAPQPQTWSLHDLDNEGATLVEYPPATFGVARLSPDGRLFVRQTASGALAVTEPATQKLVLTTRAGRVHSNVEVRLGLQCLGMSVGPHGCLIDWSAGPLRVVHGLTAANDFGGRANDTPFAGSSGPFGIEFGRFVKQFRFRTGAIGLDCFGQVAFVRDGRPACLFMYRRGKLAAWTPDGVRYGPPELTGGPDTPGAIERLGEALRKATG